ncbi:hypothetical protein DM790_17090 [Flavobacterium collinsii]|nr:hypothetical protein [Flavobacterium collinsii]
MKLKIESWIAENNFSEDVSVLFIDAVTCYKAGANRASLLFSYLALLTILKERIISGTRPALITEGEWNNLITNLQNEDLWEANVFDAVQRQERTDGAGVRTKDPVFNISENLRQQVRYWKDRRNDCAHYKDNIIDNSHVESFWNFMQSNLSKITIEGGMQSLINKIIRHFDPTITPADKDITPLIQEIEFSVERSKLKEFWSYLLDSGAYPTTLTTQKLHLTNKSFETSKDFVNLHMIAIIKENKEYLRGFLSEHPDKVLRFNFTPEEVRHFWMTQLILCNNKLAILSSFLRNGLIPQAQINDALEIAVKSVYDYVTDVSDHLTLQANGFFDVFKSEIIQNYSFARGTAYLWVNKRADLIAGVIEKYPSDEDTILRLVEHYSRPESSDWLIERFNRFFLPAAPITAAYKTILTQNGTAIPAKLQAYFS